MAVSLGEEQTAQPVGRLPKCGVGQNGSSPHQGSDEQRAVTCPRSHGTLASRKGSQSSTFPCAAATAVKMFKEI